MDDALTIAIIAAFVAPRGCQNWVAFFRDLRGEPAAPSVPTPPDTAL